VIFEKSGVFLSLYIEETQTKRCGKIGGKPRKINEKLTKMS
jgi:hypothetical protein